MTEKDKYVLVLCIIVFAGLIALFSVLVTKIVKMSRKLIRAGLEDENIVAEFKKEQHKTNKSRVWAILNTCLVVLLWGVLLFIFISTIYITACENNVVGDIPMLKVVKTGSMAEKHQDNYYLEEENINNQIQVNDVVVLHKLPDAKDLKLYDVVLYERDGELILHRIVWIVKDNPADPNTKLTFMTQGDAVQMPDDKLVEYSQMKGIYRDERTPQIGSFILFMQSPAGYLCLVVVALVTIGMPLVDSLITREKKKRLAILGYTNKGESSPNEEKQEEKEEQNRK